MCQSSNLTVGQVAEIYAVPEWKIRRIVDSMGTEIQRAGLYRLIPRSMLPAIGMKLQGAKSAQEAPR
jgi:hypothetical protein